MVNIAIHAYNHNDLWKSKAKRSHTKDAASNIDPLGIGSSGERILLQVNAEPGCKRCGVPQGRGLEDRPAKGNRLAVMGSVSYLTCKLT